MMIPTLSVRVHVDFYICDFHALSEITSSQVAYQEKSNPDILQVVPGIHGFPRIEFFSMGLETIKFQNKN